MRIRRRWMCGLLVALAACAVLAIGAVAVGTGRICITSTARPENRFDELVPVFHSASDRDGDGVDDQTDILQSAVAYVGTHPRYKSAYYAEGYPDDGCGVCTDVVAYALLGAGYDLQQLVAEDIAASPEAYGIETPDPAIDFRRTGNLAVYFERRARALTTDTADIDAWQGGDIVLYEGHVGIVSDRRNARGVPHLIHHASPFQLAYEEDCLESYGAITDHYRMAPQGNEDQSRFGR